MTILKKLTGIIAIGICLNGGLQAQQRINEAITSFNQAAGMMQTDLDSSIYYFEKCLNICEEIGDSANSVKEKAVLYLPNCYYQKTYNMFTVEKNTSGALSVGKKTVQVAEKYADDDVKSKAEKILTNAYITLGLGYFNNNEDDKAIASFDSALAINPNYTKAIYNKALLYQKEGNNAKFGENIDLFISKVKGTKDSAQVDKANKLAIEYYRNAGAKAGQANNYAEAISLLNTCFKYGEDKDVYYRLANVYNKQKNFTEGAKNAQKGLDLETGDAAAKAKFYYELGVSQVGKGDTGNACASFKKSMYGTFIEASKGQRTNLKCP